MNHLSILPNKEPFKSKDLGIEHIDPRHAGWLNGSWKNSLQLEWTLI